MVHYVKYNIWSSEFEYSILMIVNSRPFCFLGVTSTHGEFILTNPVLLPPGSLHIGPYCLALKASHTSIANTRSKVHRHP